MPAWYQTCRSAGPMFTALPGSVVPAPPRLPEVEDLRVARPGGPRLDRAAGMTSLEVRTAMRRALSVLWKCLDDRAVALCVVLAILSLSPRSPARAPRIRCGSRVTSNEAKIVYLHVTADDGKTTSEAFCSPTPFLTVLEPNNAVSVLSDGDVTKVKVAIPGIDPAHLVVLIDGVDLFAALGIANPASCGPATPCNAGPIPINETDGNPAFRDWLGVTCDSGPPTAAQNQPPRDCQ